MISYPTKCLKIPLESAEIHGEARENNGGFNTTWTRVYLVCIAAETRYTCAATRINRHLSIPTPGKCRRIDTETEGSGSCGYINHEMITALNC
jgi:hypothetical protein